MAGQCGFSEDRLDRSAIALFTKGARVMWPDNETETDFLNFTGVSDTVAEIVIQAQGRPISIGVSGAWGVGKSSMIKLIRGALEARAGGDKSKIVFVEFN